MLSDLAAEISNDMSGMVAAGFEAGIAANGPGPNGSPDGSGANGGGAEQVSSLRNLQQMLDLKRCILLVDDTWSHLLMDLMDLMWCLSRRG